MRNKERVMKLKMMLVSLGFVFVFSSVPVLGLNCSNPDSWEPWDPSEPSTST